MSGLLRVLGKLFSRPALPQEPLGGPRAKRVLRDLARRDSASLERLLLESRGRFDERYLFLELLAGHTPTEVAERWLKRAPEDPDALLLRGRLHLEQARVFAGQGPMDDDDRAALSLHLCQAEALLQASALAFAHDPTPWIYMVLAARALGRDRAHAEDCFYQAISRDTESFGAHVAMQTFLSPRGRGSRASLEDFAEQVAKRAKKGSDLGAVLLAAQVELWADERAQNGEAAAAALVAEPGRRAACIAAYERSLVHPELRRRATTLLAHNYAAVWFYLCQDRERLEAELTVIGQAFFEPPWALLDEPIKAQEAAARFLGQG